MRFLPIIIIFLALPLYTSVAQVIATMGFEQIEKRVQLSIPDSISMERYTDSLNSVNKKELLTGFVVSSFREIVPGVNIEYVVNNNERGTTKTDSFGRFYIANTQKIKSLSVSITTKEYYEFDTIFKSEDLSGGFLTLELLPKYKILLRGRVFSGNVPIEGVGVEIAFGKEKYNLNTLGCYTDDENYWNCLYLGMFKQAIVFENPGDSIYITLQQDGYHKQNITMSVGDYKGTILNYKLRYKNQLYKFPKHNMSLKAGNTFQNTWSIGIGYLYQFQLGNFNRLGLGIEGGMIMSKIETQHTTFENMSDATAQTYYASGLIGPVINISLTNPTNRKVNIYTGAVVPYLFPEGRFSVHPYLTSKYYVDLNKALFIELKYIDYTINVAEYGFNSYGNAFEQYEKRDFQKVLVSLGLLVSF
jgi:hypothetical protein